MRFLARFRPPYRRLGSNWDATVAIRGRQCLSANRRNRATFANATPAPARNSYSAVRALAVRVIDRHCAHWLPRLSQREAIGAVKVYARAVLYLEAS